MLDPPEGLNIDELLQRCIEAEAERDAAQLELRLTKKALRVARKELQGLNLTAASAVHVLNSAVNLITSTRDQLATIEVHSD